MFDGITVTSLIMVLLRGVFQLRSAPYTVLYAIQVSDLTNKNINALIGLWSNKLFQCSIVYVYYHSYWNIGRQFFFSSAHDFEKAS